MTIGIIQYIFCQSSIIATERNYSTIEKEALSIVFVVQNFKYYLLEYSLIFYVDHNALKYLINKPDLSERLARWILLFQEFNFIIVVKLDKSHANVDHLSQLELLSTEKLSPIDDNLHNE